MTTPEGRVIAKFLARCKALGLDVRKCAWEGRRGAPDRFVMVNGHHYWIEFKAPGEKLRPHQEREIARMEKSGCRVFVIDSEDVSPLDLV